jgi:hypothetical protein
LDSRSTWPIGHLQHPAHVAHRGLREQRAEGDDLRHPVAAVFFLHVADHLLAAIHAEVDVEIGHRHALGVQEPLEQQAVAQRIEVGDGQRIGHQRLPAPEPRPGPTGMSCSLAHLMKSATIRK